MQSPEIHVKIVNTSCGPHFCTVLPYIPPKPEDVTWHQKLSHRPTSRPLEERSQFTDYIMSALDKES